MNKRVPTRAPSCFLSEKIRKYNFLGQMGLLGTISYLNVVLFTTILASWLLQMIIVAHNTTIFLQC
jgi:hypothetical protein